MPILCVDGIIESDNLFLLVKRENNPLKGIYWLPGGRVYKNETLAEAFIRKMKEEVGLDVGITGVAGYYEDFYKENELGIDGVHTMSIVFTAKPLSRAIKLDSQSSDYGWFPELPAQLNIKNTNNFTDNQNKR